MLSERFFGHLAPYFAIIRVACWDNEARRCFWLPSAGWHRPPRRSVTDGQRRHLCSSTRPPRRNMALPWGDRLHELAEHAVALGVPLWRGMDARGGRGVRGRDPARGGGARPSSTGRHARAPAADHEPHRQRARDPSMDGGRGAEQEVGPGGRDGAPMPTSHGGSDDGPAAKFDGRGGAEGARKSNTCGLGATEASSRAHRAVWEGVARGCELQAPIPSRPAAGASTSSRADGAAKGVGLPSMPRLQRGVAWRDAESEDLGVAGDAEMSPSGGRVAARPRQLRVAQVLYAPLGDLLCFLCGRPRGGEEECSDCWGRVCRGCISTCGRCSGQQCDSCVNPLGKFFGSILRHGGRRTCATRLGR